MKNLNAELYSNELLEVWSKKSHLLLSEKMLFKKYLVNTSKNVLDVGTGGGRLAFYVENLGFDSIRAFDIVPGMIDYAIERGKTLNSKVKFEVGDATELLQYSSESFDYALYMQQVLNFIPTESGFKNALKESYRILKPGGIVFFSFLDYDSRRFNPLLNTFVNLIRRVRNETLLRHRLPWLKINGKFNWKLFNKNQACAYWVKEKEIIDQLKTLGYDILEVKNQSDFKASKPTQKKGMLYIVCSK